MRRREFSDMVRVPRHSRHAGTICEAGADVRHMPVWGCLLEEKASHGAAGIE
jgi:hypothetical protein